ncbi:MAG: molybdenum cofactor biosynthesis protein MoaE [Pyrinomonadaceae bacterium]
MKRRSIPGHALMCACSSSVRRGDAVGADEMTLALKAPATGASVFSEVIERYPLLARFGRSLLFAVNCEYAVLEREIEEGDEIAFFPPVSGGSGEPARHPFPQDFFELTTEPIDVGAAARRVVPRECGATVTLDGYARETTKGRPQTLYLVYEAYAPMALKEMERLGREAHQLFPQIAYIGIIHRMGRTEIGETSVAICVGAPHRRAAFEACEWAIVELKRTVPIWKKEFFAGGEEWIEGKDSEVTGRGRC